VSVLQLGVAVAGLGRGRRRDACAACAMRRGVARCGTDPRRCRRPQAAI